MRKRAVGAVAVLLACGVFAAWPMASSHFSLRPLVPGSPPTRYVGEFLRAEKDYPAGERQGPTAPSGRFTVEIKPEYKLSLPLLVDDSCHSVWLEPEKGPRLRILRLLEADPGSGSSFGLAWSSDSKALFLSGSHSGLNCTSPSNSQALRVIYTVEDGVAWELAPREAQ